MSNHNSKIAEGGSSRRIRPSHSRTDQRTIHPNAVIRPVARWRPRDRLRGRAAVATVSRCATGTWTCSEPRPSSGSIVYHLFGWPWLSIVLPAMGIMFALAGSLTAASLDKRGAGQRRHVAAPPAAASTVVARPDRGTGHAGARVGARERRHHPFSPREAVACGCCRSATRRAATRASTSGIHCGTSGRTSGSSCCPRRCTRPTRRSGWVAVAAPIVAIAVLDKTGFLAPGCGRRGDVGLRHVRGVLDRRLRAPRRPARPNPAGGGARRRRRAGRRRPLLAARPRRRGRVRSSVAITSTCIISPLLPIKCPYVYSRL